MGRRRKRSRVEMIASREGLPPPASVTPEFLLHHSVAIDTVVHFGDGKEIKRHRASVIRVCDQMLIDSYYINCNISHSQHRAAQNFYADWYLSGQSPRVTVNLLGVGGGGRGGDHGAVSHAAARKRHRAALRAVGARDQEFLIDVICYERPIPAETMKNRHVKVIRFARLRAALDLLAKHYGV